MRLLQAGLADPYDWALATGSGGEGKAGHGGEIPMRGLADLVQARIPQPEGKGRIRPVSGRRQMKNISQGKWGTIHMFIICSLAEESTMDG